MTTPRPFRFAAGRFLASSRREWMEWARAQEAAGFDVALVADHFGQQLAPTLGMLAYALATTTLRVGCTVFDNDFRHPALLANEAATLDVLTDGRLEFGIGAGWLKSEYDAAGIPFDPPGTRVQRMIESVGIIKRLWSGEEVHHAGEHYTLAGLSDPVRPVQQPRPPIFIGGGGKHLLSYAAREADIVGILPKARQEGGLHGVDDETEEAVARKVRWLHEAGGERFTGLELALLVWKIVITDTPRAEAERLAADNPNAGRTPDQILASPYFLIGSVDGIADRMIELRERFGISYFCLYPGDEQGFVPVIARLKGR